MLGTAQRDQSMRLGPTSGFIAKVEPEMHDMRESAGKTLALGDILE